ncbi:lipoyl(octanoyl) transferase LipB [Williamwhitmania taraxaci]|uniref:Octanoyltransferase n=1 Tax=Williamwhitmania taraxaci TaxID=1640674 RepID=A0A1G6I210_9BACT|nr:lipoyl(octanoyl) transferase LipB [Williamwhitmania taraxaci]SDC00514.1 lipoyl(octanoyl) transferase [Williamwhitmania taraxaci]
MRGLVTYRNLGTIAYAEGVEVQEQYFQKVLEQKQAGTLGDFRGYLLFCEHPHVYTLGKSGDATNMLITPEFLTKINASYYQTSRGGDITYHGPEQLVGYPIVDLEALNIGLKDYVHLLEEVAINVCAHYGIAASRLDGATGAWLDVGVAGRERKICAIGVRASRFITMHGWAFNVNTDLKYFSYINPCGFINKGVTSLEVELKRKVSMDEARLVFQKEWLKVFNCELLEG